MEFNDKLSLKLSASYAMPKANFVFIEFTVYVVGGIRMTNKELKYQLTELLDDLNFMYGELIADYYENNSKYTVPFGEFFAENLIANGVTIRERGEWIKRTQCSEPECSKCGRCPKLVFGMLPDFCPHCGADMRGVKDASSE